MSHRHLRTPNLIALLIALPLIACSSDDGSTNGEPDTHSDATEVSFTDTDTSPLDTVGPETTPDTTGPDTQADTDTTGPCQSFGCPCSSNADCLDGLCVEGADGRVCSVPCVTQCPDDSFACLPVTLGGADPFTACVPLHPHLCKPCRLDDDCKNALLPNATALCIATNDPSEGSFCGSSCATSPCPSGYTCTDVPLAGGGQARQCLPTEALCECRPSWASMNLSTDCHRTNAIGTCSGERACGPDGLSPCDAGLPAPETCNGIDDDCNDTTDDIAASACIIDNGVGLCPGTSACSGLTTVCVGRAATIETCNLVDDDCDGRIDEGTCDDDLDCTTDRCAAPNTCEHTTLDGFCVIERQCVAAETPNPANACQRCIPSASTTSWTGAGVGCFIEGVCYANGADNPTNPCLYCNPSLPGSWSAKTNGTFCSDSDNCTLVDTCQFGQCVPGPRLDCDDGIDCTTDACSPTGECVNTYPEVLFEDCSNGLDDDCDGLTDEGMPEQCGDLIDNDCDGQTDESANTWGETFFARGWSGTTPSTVAIYTSNDGTFAPPKVITFPDNRAYGIVAIGDFDADGFRDLIVSAYNHNTRTTCTTTANCPTDHTCYGGTCHRNCTQQSDCGLRDQCVDTGEFSANDSYCLSTTTLFLARERCPDGNVELLPLSAIDPGASVAAIIDANNDGHLDIVVRRPWALRSGYTLLNQGDPGNLAFTRLDTRPGDASIPALPMDTATCTWVYALSKNAKDMNGDGLVDMLGFCNPSGGNTPPTLWIFRGRGDGSFERKFDLAQKPIWPLSLLTANDFDGDGDHDILGGLDDDGNPGAASLLLNLGASTGALWSAAYQILDVTPTNTSGSDAPGVGNGTSFDYTGDGYPDLLLAWAPDVQSCSYVWSATCTTTDLALFPNITANPCGEGQTCNASNQCVACTPVCSSRTCGSDGCGGTCGGCLPSEVCGAAGTCIARNDCIPNCGVRTCGDDGCGGQCGTCGAGQGCVNGLCQACTPSCAGKACGGDGCGGKCAFFGAPVTITRDTNSRYAESPTNTPPTAPGITILPATPSTNDDLVCAVTTPSYDLDPVRLEYRWFRSGTYAKDVGNKARVSRSFTGTGQVWECRVRASDGVEWSPVSTTSVTID